MKITISCAGRFHAYNLAAQMQRYSVLDRLITTYPKSEVRKFGISTEKIRSFLLWEFLNRGLIKVQAKTGWNPISWHPSLYVLFENWSAKQLSGSTDVYVGWSAFSERGLKVTKQNGGVSVLERGSSHIEIQTQLLMDEYKQHVRGRSVVVTHPKVIQKELREYELADFISVPSSFVKRSFLEKGFPPDKIVQNPYGVSLSEFNPGVKVDDVFRVIYVGQMSLRKGVHYLIKAFSELQLPNSELILIGGMTDHLKPFLSGSHSQIKYLGIKVQSELIHYYQQASVFAICSIEEGMAMVQAQAMACGLPILCTTHTGGEDLISEGKEGFIVPIRDVEAIKEKLSWFYFNQEETYRMGRAAHEKIVSGYTWDDYGDRYYKFLNSL